MHYLAKVTFHDESYGFLDTEGGFTCCEFDTAYRFDLAEDAIAVLESYLDRFSGPWYTPGYATGCVFVVPDAPPVPRPRVFQDVGSVPHGHLVEDVLGIRHLTLHPSAWGAYSLESNRYCEDRVPLMRIDHDPNSPFPPPVLVWVPSFDTVIDIGAVAEVTLTGGGL